jgi:uncharacterized membrane protein (GlpM family)
MSSILDRAIAVKHLTTSPLRHFGTAVGIAIGLCLAVIIYLYDPAMSSILPPCPFHAITGLYCPGCGSSRAVHQLMHGHLVKAFDLNPLMISFLPFMGWSLIQQARGRQILTRPIWIWTILAVILIFWVLRNIPVYPLTLLAP